MGRQTDGKRERERESNEQTDYSTDGRATYISLYIPETAKSADFR